MDAFRLNLSASGPECENDKIIVGSYWTAGEGRLNLAVFLNRMSDRFSGKKPGGFLKWPLSNRHR